MAASAARYFSSEAVRSEPTSDKESAFEGVDSKVDMSSFPLIRLDHIPLLQTSILERAMSELKYLYDPGIDAYKQKLQAEIKRRFAFERQLTE